MGRRTRLGCKSLTQPQTVSLFAFNFEFSSFFTLNPVSLKTWSKVNPYRLLASEVSLACNPCRFRPQDLKTRGEVARAQAVASPTQQGGNKPSLRHTPQVFMGALHTSPALSHQHLPGPDEASSQAEDSGFRFRALGLGRLRMFWWKYFGDTATVALSPQDSTPSIHLGSCFWIARPFFRIFPPGGF